MTQEEATQDADMEVLSRTNSRESYTEDEGEEFCRVGDSDDDSDDTLEVIRPGSSSVDVKQDFVIPTEYESLLKPDVSKFAADVIAKHPLPSPKTPFSKTLSFSLLEQMDKYLNPASSSPKPLPVLQESKKTKTKTKTKTGKSPAKEDDKPPQIPSTRNWTRSQLLFFKLSIYEVGEQIDPYIISLPCELPPAAAAILELENFTQQQLIDGDFYDPKYNYSDRSRDFLEQYKEISLNSSFASESAVDHFILTVLKACNPFPQIVNPVPQRARISIRVGQFGLFRSICDASVTLPRMRPGERPATLVVVENKPWLSTSAKLKMKGEEQLLGEMEAAACANYLIKPKAYIMFGILIEGINVKFYRADFSAKYLASVLVGTIAERITVFKSRKYPISPHGRQREGLQIISAILKFTAVVLSPHTMAPREVDHPIVKARLAALANSRTCN